MSQPTNYNKVRNFSEWAAANPGTVYSGADMDQEFDNIETTLDATLNNLAIIQRDDGKLANASVHQDSFSSTALSLIASDWTPRGLWATATAYVIGDVVENSGASYVCSVVHTSGTFTTDHTAGKWIAINGGVAASEIVSSPVGSLTASNVQSALQELDADLTAHLNDTADAHDATAISYAGSSGLSAVTAEAALDELAVEKANDANVVHLTGAELISGDKTFTGKISATATTTGNIWRSPKTITTVSADAPSTYTAAGIVGGIIVRTGLTTSRSDTMDTATNIIAALVDPYVGMSFELTVINNSGWSIFLLSGAGLTMTAETIPSAAKLSLVGIITGVGIPAITVYPTGRYS